MVNINIYPIQADTAKGLYHNEFQLINIITYEELGNLVTLLNKGCYSLLHEFVS